MGLFLIVFYFCCYFLSLMILECGIVEMWILLLIVIVWVFVLVFVGISFRGFFIFDGVVIVLLNNRVGWCGGSEICGVSWFFFWWWVYIVRFYIGYIVERCVCIKVYWVRIWFFDFFVVGGGYWKMFVIVLFKVVFMV